MNTVATTRLLEKTENRKEVASGRLSKWRSASFPLLLPVNVFWVILENIALLATISRKIDGGMVYRPHQCYPLTRNYMFSTTLIASCGFPLRWLVYMFFPVHLPSFGNLNMTTTQRLTVGKHNQVCSWELILSCWFSFNSISA